MKIELKLPSACQFSESPLRDEDCHDIDLRLYDPSGNEVASDLRTDDWPIVMVTPSYSGTYQVRVVMASCSKNPCYYRIGVFSK